ncbi:MAG: hypothetical protein JWR69_2503 [Pedosphaera sp.]|nr:hypothetical protein [Pedosphaera sp.]
MFQQATEFFLADVEMGAFAGGEVLVGFVFHFQSFEMHDLKVLVALIINLALLQLHWEQYTRGRGGGRGEFRMTNFELRMSERSPSLLFQWLPKPATSRFPEKGRSLRELWSQRLRLAGCGGKWVSG